MEEVITHWGALSTTHLYTTTICLPPMYTLLLLLLCPLPLSTLHCMFTQTCLWVKTTVSQYIVCCVHLLSLLLYYPPLGENHNTGLLGRGGCSWCSPFLCWRDLVTRQAGVFNQDWHMAVLVPHCWNHPKSTYPPSAGIHRVPAWFLLLLCWCHSLNIATLTYIYHWADRNPPS